MKQIKEFLKELFGFFNEKSGKSSMRLGFVLTTFGGFWVMLRLANYIDTFADKGIELTQWDGMAIFTLAVGGVMTGMAWAKMRQKGLENNSKNNGGVTESD